MEASDPEETRRLYQAAQRRAEELNTIIELSRLITQNLDLEQVFASAQQAISRLMSNDAFFITVLDRKTNENVAQYILDKGVRYPPRRWPADQGISGYVIRTGQPLLIRSVEKEPLPAVAIHYGDEESVRSILAVPLQFSGQTIGMISTQSYRENAFDEHDLQLLQSIADHVAIAIEHANLYADLQQRYMSLQELNEWRVQLLQNVSHELRTPLTFLKAYVDMLLDGFGMGELSAEQRESLKIVQLKTSTLVRLVEDITVLEMGEKSLRLAEINLPDLVRLSIAAAQHTAARRGIAIELNCPAEFPPVQADADRIVQVLDNLLGNAIKFAYSDSKIEVRLQAFPTHAWVSVTDQGEGIPKSEQAHIFERFYQVNRPPNRRRGGLGLGLAIVKKIVEMHSGTVWVESEEGKGSTFYFTLPYRQADSFTPTNHPPSQLTLPGLEKDIAS